MSFSQWGDEVWGEGKILDRMDSESSLRKYPEEVRELVVWPRQEGCVGERFRKRTEFQSVQGLWCGRGPGVLKEKQGAEQHWGMGAEDEVCHVLGRRGQIVGMLVDPRKGDGSLLRVKKPLEVSEQRIDIIPLVF